MGLRKKLYQYKVDANQVSDVRINAEAILLDDALPLRTASFPVDLIAATMADGGAVQSGEWIVRPYQCARLFTSALYRDQLLAQVNVHF